jgi:hypothetical protein
MSIGKMDIEWKEKLEAWLMEQNLIRLDSTWPSIKDECDVSQGNFKSSLQGSGRRPKTIYSTFAPGTSPPAD